MKGEDSIKWKRDLKRGGLENKERNTVVNKTVFVTNFK